MVGLGGGFIIVPVLRLFFGLSPAAAAGTSLTLVLANSASGSAAYLMQRRVHLRTAWLIAAGGLPGGVLGAIAVKHASPRVFDWLFAAFLIAVSLDIIRRSEKRIAGEPNARNLSTIATILAGFAVGFVSSLFGVGGGVVLVPSLLYFSTLPAHAISATSQFAILLTSPVGFVTHVFQNDIEWTKAIPLAIGGLIGGPVGARLSMRLKSRLLLLFVGFALMIAAVALVLRHVVG